MIIAVDTGGTKTLVGRFSKNGGLSGVERFETPKDFGEYITILTETITIVAASKPIEAISIGLPGPIKNGATLAYARNIGWQPDLNIAALLKSQFSCPILVENDANLAGLAEIRSLANIPRVGLYITVSTGIGTGIIINGRLLPEWQRSEGGQILLERDGVLQTWESFASGSAIYKRYGKFAKDIHSKRAWHQIAKDISQGIVALAPVIDPDTIVIGGSIGTYFDQYKQEVKDFLKERLEPLYQPSLRRAKHPERAVLYGAYLYALDTLDL